jgi:hypothetical protein
MSHVRRQICRPVTISSHATRAMTCDEGSEGDEEKGCPVRPSIPVGAPVFRCFVGWARPTGRFEKPLGRRGLPVAVGVATWWAVPNGSK